MKEPIKHQPDPSLDLYFERIVDVPKELVWKAWTTPELLEQWFTPAPWKTRDVKVDLRPGGNFTSTMCGPEGEEFTGAGCYLEIVENAKLVWTSALGPGYRPQAAAEGAFVFTAVITLEDHGTGTKYTALAIHPDVEACEKHKAMGFHEGWGAAFDQLVALMKSQP
ncbi:MAG: SRPBCC family protein [Fimbriimonas sp.]